MGTLLRPLFPNLMAAIQAEMPTQISVTMLYIAKLAFQYCRCKVIPLPQNAISAESTARYVAHLSHSQLDQVSFFKLKMLWRHPVLFRCKEIFMISVMSTKAYPWHLRQ